MARPKGIKQKRNEDKYKLPVGVSLKNGQTDDFYQETQLIFIDDKYGEFVSTFKAMRSGNSVHPEAVNERRKNTNISKYGVANPGANGDIRNKIKKTMVERYGVEHALLNKELLKKSQTTLMNNYQVNTPMESTLIKDRIKKNVLSIYGVDNPMKNESVKQKLKETMIERYGVDNYAKTSEFKEKFFTTLGDSFSSEQEKELREFVSSLGFSCKSGFLGGANPKQIDIMIDNSDVCIEYNGCYWHSEANKNMHKKYHLEKTELAKEKNLQLIHIFEHEWNSRKEQVKSFLKSKLGVNKIKVFARKTELKEVDKDEMKKFLNKYHILGSTNFIKAYGLYYNNELISGVTIGKHHRNNKEYILSRYITKENYNITGGLSKLCTFAAKEFGNIYTWIDRRWSDGQNWTKAGWKEINILPPDYFYFNIKNGQVVSKQSRKKNRVQPPKGVTETQYAYNEGLRRIYDCGKIKLVWKATPTIL